MPFLCVLSSVNGIGILAFLKVSRYVVLGVFKAQNVEEERRRGQRDRERKRKRKYVKNHRRKEREKSLENHVVSRVKKKGSNESM